MPRKKNGYGNFGVSSFNGISKSVNRGKGSKALGRYPSERRFGSTIQRSAIEQFNIDSTWQKWRKGLEYYFQGAYLDFNKTEAVLYQGTDYEIPVTFDGYRFATKNSDSRTHYCIHRTIDQNRQLGFITELEKSTAAYPEQYKNREIYAKVIATRTLTSDDMLLRSTGERITDGVTSANISWILTDDKRPAIYMGKSPTTGSTVTIRVPLDGIKASEFIQKNNGNLLSLVGQAVYMPDFLIERTIGSLDRFTDEAEFMNVEVADLVANTRVVVLDNQSNLPPTLGDVSDLTPIFETTDTTGRLNGAFDFKKDIYQRFWGQQYLTADLMRQNVDRLSYAIQPWIVQSILVDEPNNKLQIDSVPFQSSIRLFSPRASERYVVFSDNSFTKEYPDYDADGNYNHQQGLPGDKEWTKLDTDIDPWQDEIFTSGNALTFSDLYTCSCPDYLHAIIRSPEIYNESGGLSNRQERLPMPTAKGANDYDIAGIARAAGIAQTWSTMSYRKAFKLCKHTIASMFINKTRVQEPNTFPAFDAREKFETNLAQDINEVSDEFNAQLKRSEITTVEVIYALAEALNLDDVELGYVLLTSRF